MDNDHQQKRHGLEMNHQYIMKTQIGWLQPNWSLGERRRLLVLRSFNLLFEGLTEPHFKFKNDNAAKIVIKLIIVSYRPKTFSISYNWIQNNATCTNLPAAKLQI